MFNPPAPKSAVSRWEHGGSPNKKRLKRIAELGQTTVDQLLHGDNYVSDDDFVEIMKKFNRETIASGVVSDNKSADIESFDEIINYFENFFRRTDLPQTLKDINYTDEFISSANTALMTLMLLINNGIQYASYIDNHPELKSKWSKSKWVASFLALPNQFAESSMNLYIQEQELYKELKKIKSNV